MKPMFFWIHPEDKHNKNNDGDDDLLLERSFLLQEKPDIPELPLIKTWETNFLIPVDDKQVHDMLLQVRVSHPFFFLALVPKIFTINQGNEKAILNRCNKCLAPFLLSINCELQYSKNIIEQISDIYGYKDPSEFLFQHNSLLNIEEAIESWKNRYPQAESDDFVFPNEDTGISTMHDIRSLHLLACSMNTIFHFLFTIYSEDYNYQVIDFMVGCYQDQESLSTETCCLYIYCLSQENSKQYILESKNYRKKVLFDLSHECIGNENENANEKNEYCECFEINGKPLVTYINPPEFSKDMMKNQIRSVKANIKENNNQFNGLPSIKPLIIEDEGEEKYKMELNISIPNRAVHANLLKSFGKMFSYHNSIVDIFDSQSPLYENNTSKQYFGNSAFLARCSIDYQYYVVQTNLYNRVYNLNQVEVSKPKLLNLIYNQKNDLNISLRFLLKTAFNDSLSLFRSISFIGCKTVSIINFDPKDYFLLYNGMLQCSSVKDEYYLRLKCLHGILEKMTKLGMPNLQLPKKNENFASDLNFVEIHQIQGKKIEDIKKEIFNPFPFLVVYDNVNRLSRTIDINIETMLKNSHSSYHYFEIKFNDLTIKLKEMRNSDVGRLKIMVPVIDELYREFSQIESILHYQNVARSRSLYNVIKTIQSAKELKIRCNFKGDYDSYPISYETIREKIGLMDNRRSIDYKVAFLEGITKEKLTGQILSKLLENYQNNDEKKYFSLFDHYCSSKMDDSNMTTQISQNHYRYNFIPTRINGEIAINPEFQIRSLAPIKYAYVFDKSCLIVTELDDIIKVFLIKKQSIGLNTTDENLIATKPEAKFKNAAISWPKINDKQQIFVMFFQKNGSSQTSYLYLNFDDGKRVLDNDSKVDEYEGDFVFDKVDFLYENKNIICMQGYNGDLGNDDCDQEDDGYDGQEEDGDQDKDEDASDDNENHVDQEKYFVAPIGIGIPLKVRHPDDDEKIQFQNGNSFVGLTIKGGEICFNTTELEIPNQCDENGYVDNPIKELISLKRKDDSKEEEEEEEESIDSTNEDDDITNKIEFSLATFSPPNYLTYCDGLKYQKDVNSVSFADFLCSIIQYFPVLVAFSESGTFSAVQRKKLINFDTPTYMMVPYCPACNHLCLSSRIKAFAAKFSSALSLYSIESLLRTYKFDVRILATVDSGMPNCSKVIDEMFGTRFYGTEIPGVWVGFCFDQSMIYQDEKEAKVIDIIIYFKSSNNDKNLDKASQAALRFANVLLLYGANSHSVELQKQQIIKDFETSSISGIIEPCPIFNISMQINDQNEITKDKLYLSSNDQNRIQQITDFYKSEFNFNSYGIVDYETGISNTKKIVAIYATMINYPLIPTNFIIRNACY